MRTRRRRATPTRGWIIESFNKLVLRRGYDRIGVTEVAAGAGVGRSTFYEHFGGKGDVLRDAVRGVLESFADLVSRPDDGGPSLRTAEHIATHRPEAHRILKAAGDELARQLAELIRLRLPPGAGRLPRALAGEHIARAQLGLLRAWVAPLVEPCPPATFAAALRDSTKALVEACRR